MKSRISGVKYTKNKKCCIVTIFIYVFLNYFLKNFANPRKDKIFPNNLFNY